MIKRALTALILNLFLILFISPPVYCEPLVPNESYNKLKEILRANKFNYLFFPEAQVHELLRDITYEQTAELYFLYSVSRYDITTAASLNLLCPSLGSWIMGDYLSAILTDIMLVPGVYFTVTGLDYPGSLDFYLGIYCLASCYIFSLISVPLSALDYNFRLQEALGLKKPTFMNSLKNGNLFTIPVLSVAF